MSNHSARGIYVVVVTFVSLGQPWQKHSTVCALTSCKLNFVWVIASLSAKSGLFNDTACENIVRTFTELKRGRTTETRLR